MKAAPLKGGRGRQHHPTRGEGGKQQHSKGEGKQAAAPTKNRETKGGEQQHHPKEGGKQAPPQKKKGTTGGKASPSTRPEG